MNATSLQLHRSFASSRDARAGIVVATGATLLGIAIWMTSPRENREEVRPRPSVPRVRIDDALPEPQKPLKKTPDPEKQKPPAAQVPTRTVQPPKAPPALPTVKTTDPAGGDGPLQSGSVSGDVMGTPGDGTGGPGTAATRLAYRFYATAVTRHIHSHLVNKADPALKRTDFAVTVLVWLRDDGRVDHVDVQHGPSAADPTDIEAGLRAALATMPPLAQPFPVGLPQPLRLAITGRMLN